LKLADPATGAGRVVAQEDLDVLGADLAEHAIRKRLVILCDVGAAARPQHALSV
jgi:hypothetical protein